MKIEIETKFDVGDVVYTIDEDKIMECIIKSISILFDKHILDNNMNEIKEVVEIRYYVQIPNKEIQHYQEGKLFGSVDELIKDNLIKLTGGENV